MLILDPPANSRLPVVAMRSSPWASAKVESSLLRAASYIRLEL
jgi:hypothetical protein